MRRRARAVLGAALALASLTGCATSGGDRAGPAGPPVSAIAGGPVEAPAASPAPSAPARPPGPGPANTEQVADGSPVQLGLRLERRTADAGTDGFEELALAILNDPRGWRRAGFTFTADPASPYRLVLAEGSEVDALCLPYETNGRYSCQNGPVVALNADRWRAATTKWTGTLDDYRRYLVNHEVGHLLGLRHPRVQCPRPGRPAPIMNQQSTELRGCLPNPWPLDHEVVEARRRPVDLAPGPVGR